MDWPLSWSGSYLEEPPWVGVLGGRLPDGINRPHPDAKAAKTPPGRFSTQPKFLFHCLFFTFSNKSNKFPQHLSLKPKWLPLNCPYWGGLAAGVASLFQAVAKGKNVFWNCEPAYAAQNSVYGSLPNSPLLSLLAPKGPPRREIQKRPSEDFPEDNRTTFQHNL